MRATVFMVSPSMTISRFTSPISPTTSGPWWSAPRSCGAEPNSEIVFTPPVERVSDGEEANDCSRGGIALRCDPCNDALIADIALDLPARIEHRIGDVKEDAVE